MRKPLFSFGEISRTAVRVRELTQDARVAMTLTYGL
jgi:hypothetical protein